MRNFNYLCQSPWQRCSLASSHSKSQPLPTVSLHISTGASKVTIYNSILKLIFVKTATLKR